MKLKNHFRNPNVPYSRQNIWTLTPDLHHYIYVTSFYVWIGEKYSFEGFETKQNPTLENPFNFTCLQNDAKFLTVEKPGNLISWKTTFLRNIGQ